MNVLITGASRGLGLALASRYAARTENHVFAVARRVSIVRADVADASAPEHIATAVGATPLDLLVNNAGASERRGFGDLTQDALVDLFKVNVFAPLLVTQALRSKLAADAKVVNVSSVLGSIAQAGAGYFAYGASKAALNMITKKLAAELPGVAVLALHPGWVRTRMGGPGAAIDVATSADGMVRVIDAFDVARSGAYLTYEGAELPW